MKSSIRLDHLATWKEVCHALSFSVHDAFELRGGCDADRESEPGFREPVCTFAEELAWLALAREAQDPFWN